MSNITSLDFAALDLSGANYLQWALDVEISLRSKGLYECIEEGNQKSDRDRCKALAFIRHHLIEGLKRQYQTLKDPLDLWKELKVRYDHHKTVLLPQAQYDWRNLRFQDFKSVDEYNSAMFLIVSDLRFCKETVSDHDMLEKTFSTMHPENVLLQQQYRNQKYETYNELISVLLLAEKNNTLLMRNSALRPPGSAPLPETHTAIDEQKETNHVQDNRHGGRGRGGKWHGRGRGQHHQPYGRGGRGSSSYRGRGRGYGRSYRGRGTGSKPGTHRTSDTTPKPQALTTSVCHRCGMGNHWAKNCRAHEHFVQLYQKSLKEKNPEPHQFQHDNEGDFDHENDDQLDYETSDLLK